jgi:hypothetical protein
MTAIATTATKPPQPTTAAAAPGTRAIPSANAVGLALLILIITEGIPTARNHMVKISGEEPLQARCRWVSACHIRLQEGEGMIVGRQVLRSIAIVLGQGGR